MATWSETELHHGVVVAESHSTYSEYCQIMSHLFLDLKPLDGQIVKLSESNVCTSTPQLKMAAPVIDLSYMYKSNQVWTADFNVFSLLTRFKHCDELETFKLAHFWNKSSQMG